MEKVIELLEEILERLEEVEEGQAQLREAISNMSLPGRDYDIEDFE